MFFLVFFDFYTCVINFIFLSFRNRIFQSFFEFSFSFFFFVRILFSPDSFFFYSLSKNNTLKMD